MTHSELKAQTENNRAVFQLMWDNGIDSAAACVDLCDEILEALSWVDMRTALALNEKLNAALGA